MSDVDIGEGGWYGDGRGGGDSDHRGDGDPLCGEHVVAQLKICEIDNHNQILLESLTFVRLVKH